MEIVAKVSQKENEIIKVKKGITQISKTLVRFRHSFKQAFLLFSLAPSKSTSKWEQAVFYVQQVYFLRSQAVQK